MVLFYLTVPSLMPGAAVRAAQEDEPAQQLRDAERSREQQRAIREQAAERAAKALADSVRLGRARADAVVKLRETEARTAAVAARMDDLAQRRREAEQRLKDRAAALRPLLPLIERLSLYPAETLLALPVAPDDALRGVLVLQGLAHRLEQQAEALRHDQAVLDAASAALNQEAPLLTDAQAAQKRQEDALDRQIAASHAAQAAAEAQATEAARQAEEAATRATTLRSAVAALEAVRRAGEVKAREEAARAERQKRDADVDAARQREADLAHPSGAGTLSGENGPHGQLQPPVTGVVVKSWGEPTDGGPATGVSYRAAPSARVICPCSGRVVFAEPFRSYGLLLIVDCGGGYHVVLSGFATLDVKLGQKIVAGEPVGVMPSWEPGTTAARPYLYVELRHDGQPVNPAPWLRPSF